MFIYIIVTRILLLVLKVFFCLEYYSSGNLLITAEIQTNKIYIYIKLILVTVQKKNSQPLCLKHLASFFLVTFLKVLF